MARRLELALAVWLVAAFIPPAVSSAASHTGNSSFAINDFTPLELFRAE